MRLFVCHSLFILITGNFLSGVRGHCGGKADVLGEKSGSIRYSTSTGLQSGDLTYDETLNGTVDTWPNITCTWTINAQENQTVWIEVVHVDEDSSLLVKFGNETAVKEQGGVLFTGTGRTTVEWSWRNDTKASRKLHLRWNTSEDGHDPAQVPYTHSDNDPVSPSPDAPNRVTRAPDILGLGSASPSAHTLWGTSARRGGGVSGTGDKTGPPVPQEGEHNGQEKAGATVSDLAHADTHTPSTLSHTQTAPALAPPSAETESPASSARTSAGHLVIAMATGAQSDNARTVAQTQSLPEIYPGLHNGSEAALTKTTTASSRAAPPAEPATDSAAAITAPTVRGLNPVTESDVPMTTWVTLNQPRATMLANAPNSQAPGTETSHSPRSTQPNRDISNQTQATGFSDWNTVSGPPAGSAPNQTTFSHQEGTSYSEASGSPSLRTLTTSREDGEKTPSAEHQPSTPFETRPTPTVHTLDSTSPYVSHTVQDEGSTIPQPTSSASGPSSTEESGSTNTLNHTANLSRTFPPLLPTTASSFGTSVGGLTEGDGNYTPTLATHSPNTVKQETSPATIASGSMPPSDMTTTQVQPTVSPDLAVQGTVTTGGALRNASEQDPSPLGTQPFTPKALPHTRSPPAYSTEVSTATNFPQTVHGGNDISHANSSQSGPMIPVSISPSISSESGSVEVTRRPSGTERNDPVTPTTFSPVISLSSAISTAREAASTPSQWTTSGTPAVTPPLRTTQQAKMTQTPNSSYLTTSRNIAVVPSRVPTEQLFTPSRQPSPSQTPSHAPSTASHTQTSRLLPVTQKTDPERPHRGRVFVVEDQPATIKVETFQVLLQVVLEGNFPTNGGLVKVEPFLHQVPGYQSQQVTWHSGPVLQTVVTFRTVEALSWLGRVESLLHEAGLSPLPRDGIFVGGVRVKNITVGGLHTDVCSWLFMCPSGFQCVSSEGNASCRSLCHTEFCKHHGICVHHPGQQPLCQCPVGEDFWFMGPRCDLRMTRQRLVGVCFGVLLAVAMLMALLSYLAVRRFKSMLVQAKVDQTRSSYRRFNHFDELSARFWGRSWPGSEDSLDNPAFTRSDELLHMRALDRTCCYHDDTLSLASTYQDSVSHLNTVYPHSSQYRWDLSNYSLADCVVDSGKASDLSVCSWPIEPIQWTPFPLLQQLSRNTASVKASRPRSYCEGMEMVDLEKSWTA